MLVACSTVSDAPRESGPPARRSRHIRALTSRSPWRSRQFARVLLDDLRRTGARDDINPRSSRRSVTAPGFIPSSRKQARRESSRREATSVYHDKAGARPGYGRSIRRVRSGPRTRILIVRPADPMSQWRARYLRERAPPGSVVLSISQKLQQAAVAALGNRRGAIVAIDPRNGTILASASWPQYDASLISDPATEESAWKQVNEDPDKPLINRVTQGLYPPGSTFKIITGAAAMESGVDPNASSASRSVAADRRGVLCSLFVARARDYTSLAFRLSGTSTSRDRAADRRWQLAETRTASASAARRAATFTRQRPLLAPDSSPAPWSPIPVRPGPISRPLHNALVAAAVGIGGLMPTRLRDGFRYRRSPSECSACESARCQLETARPSRRCCRALSGPARSHSRRRPRRRRGWQDRSARTPPADCMAVRGLRPPSVAHLVSVAIGSDSPRGGEDPARPRGVSFGRKGN